MRSGTHDHATPSRTGLRLTPESWSHQTKLTDARLPTLSPTRCTPVPLRLGERCGPFCPRARPPRRRLVFHHTRCLDHSKHPHNSASHMFLPTPLRGLQVRTAPAILTSSTSTAMARSAKAPPMDPVAYSPASPATRRPPPRRARRAVGTLRLVMVGCPDDRSLMKPLHLVARAASAAGLQRFFAFTHGDYALPSRLRHEDLVQLRCDAACTSSRSLGRLA